MKCSYPGGVAPPGRVKASAAPRPLFEVRVPITVLHGEGENQGDHAAGAPSSVGVFVRASNAVEAAERILDALQRAVDR